MKFSEVKIGAQIKSPNLYYFIKVDNKNASFIDDNGRWCTLKCDSDSEWELITKCYNCKHFDSHIRFCDKLGTGIELGDDESIDQDPETFSCSIFEMTYEEVKK